MFDQTTHIEQLTKEIESLKEIIAHLEFQLASLYSEKDTNTDSDFVTETQTNLLTLTNE
jgi:hypothetical protein